MLQAVCDKELINGWGGAWEPFITGTYDKPSGFDMDILDAVVRTAGCTWKNTQSEIPWARHMAWIKSGKLDLATAVSWTQERAEFAYFTKPYRNEYVAIFVRKADIKKYVQLSLQDLASSKFNIGAELGNVYGGEMDSLLERMGNRVEYVNTNKQNINKLLSKRIDGYIGFIPFDSMHIIEEGHMKDIIMLPESLVSTGKVHIMLSKESNSKEILKALDAALAEIKTNGVYDQIIKKYSDKYGVSYW